MIAKNKSMPKYDPVPFTITNINHSMITAIRGKEVKTRNSSFFIHYMPDSNMGSVRNDRLLPNRVITDHAISTSTSTTTNHSTSTCPLIHSSSPSSSRSVISNDQSFELQYGDLSNLFKTNYNVIRYINVNYLQRAF